MGRAKELKVTVSKEWLQNHLGSKNLKVLDTRSAGAYRKSHVPGAVHADLFHYFIPGTDPRGLERFHRDLARRLGNLGLEGNETIVVYESSFGMRAARVAWMLEYAGAPKVFLLEGGFEEWRKSRLPTEKKVVKPVHQVFQIKPVPKLLATADDVHASRRALILDVRSEGEFAGKEGRECDDRLGRIPKAQWFEWTNFLAEKQRFRSLSEIAGSLRSRGLSRKRAVITYCHRGARAAAAFYALRSLGYENVRNYIGSWHEWSARKALPVAK